MMGARGGGLQWVTRVALAVLSGLASCGMALAQVPGMSRVSVDIAGAQVFGTSRQPSLSRDGRYVAFSSDATTLTAGDANGFEDIFLKDRQTNAVTLVSVTNAGGQANGASLTPSLSSGGRYVAFMSYAALVAGDTRVCAVGAGPQPTCADIYVRDIVGQTTERISVASDGGEPDGESFNPVISPDGRFVLFESDATNLVVADTNQARDIFLRDRQTHVTRRISVATSGAEANGGSRMASLTDDAQTIAFISPATNLDPAADTLPCQPGHRCDRVYLRTLSGTTTRVPLTMTFLVPDTHVAGAQISGDGTAVVAFSDQPFDQQGSPTSVYGTRVLVSHNLATGRTRMLHVSGYQLDVPVFVPTISVSGDGRVVAICDQQTLSVDDAVLGEHFAETLSVPTLVGQPCFGASISRDGLLLSFATIRSDLVANDSNFAADVFVDDRDRDHDGMASVFETAYGLNPDDPGDGPLDPDNDGLTNRQEYERGSHPKGLFKRYLAEGADNDFFKTSIDLFNPDKTTATLVAATFTGQNGVITTGGAMSCVGFGGVQLLGYNRAWVPLPDQSFSTLVESDRPVAVERTMSWAGGDIGIGYGSAAETAVANPQTTWFFAEGATHGQFDLFYLLQNPTSTDTRATVTYLLPSGTPIVKAYDLRANSRLTIYVDQEPGLEATDVSAKIEAGVPIFAERAMYLSTPDQAFAGGTAGAGIAAPATEWFVAEGATGDFFDLYVLIGNPSAQDASVTITYLLPGGETIEKSYVVPKQSRRTIGVDNEDPRLASAEVSARVTSTNAVPIIVERSMWWPSPQWYEGHLTAATTETGTKWAFAGAYIGKNADMDTYLLIANPSDTAATVTVTVNGLLPGPSNRPCETTVPAPAHSRVTRSVKNDLTCGNGSLWTGPLVVPGTVESDGPGIVVERSTYWSTPSQFWSAGASTLLTKIQ
jgi:hypothetical protein